METTGLFSARVDSSLRWVSFARERNHPSALEAYCTALRLLDNSVTLTHSLPTQHAHLTTNASYLRAKGLASDAAALAIDCLQPEKAVELLELGRGILLGQLGRYRTPLDDLRAANEELAKEFTEISTKLENSVVVTNNERATDKVGR